MDSPLLRVEDVSRVYETTGGASRVAVAGASLDVAAGETVAIVGRSGSGKSTFLHLLAGIDVPSSGRVLLDGRDLGALDEPERCRVRRDEIGLVFQFFHLLPQLTVEENVAVPALLAGESLDAVRARVHELLGHVDLADRAGDVVPRLSGGEMQRVALCRALLRRPRLLLADEPTGNLDDATSAGVMELLLEMAREDGSALVYVTHSRAVAGRADRVLEMASGALAPREEAG